MRQELVKKGQAALIVLLVVAVALGFGLSTISRSTTELKISKQEQEASRAFNAAEAGIEEALRTLAVGAGSIKVREGTDDEIEVNYIVEESSVLENVFGENDSAQVNLTGASADLTSIVVEWVDESDSVENPGCDDEDNTTASILVSIIKEAGADYALRREAYNSCNLLSNGMTYISDSGSDNYLKQIELAVAADDQLVRIRPIYNEASIRVTGKDASGDSVDLPVQLYRIDSRAQSVTLESKAVEVTRTIPSLPSVFDYVLFSGTGIVK